MKFTLSWLKQFLDTEASLDQIVDTLTIIGLEVEEVIDRGAEYDKFSVAEILSSEKHPDADKLKICKVKTYKDERQIVCGAENARAGIKVVMADIGAIVPNGGFKIKQSKIRGVESNGMLCSAEELNLGRDSSGIMELENDASLLESFSSYMGFDDPIIHVNITPNRGDALGVYGIARDLEAAGVGRLKSLSSLKFGSDFLDRGFLSGAGDSNILSDINIGFESKYSVEIEDENICPYFATRKLINISNKKSPKWLVRLLSSIGVGSISAIVDITNYICFSFGQPMHVYDASKILGNIRVGSIDQLHDNLAEQKSNLYEESTKDSSSEGLDNKKSSDQSVGEGIDHGQKFMALNDKEYKLEKDDLVIKDDEKVICLAGIIGGKNTASFDDASEIILEAAYFNHDVVTKTSRRLQIDTDSKYRFERKIDHNFTKTALTIATNMVLAICGGKAGRVVHAGLETSKKRHLVVPYSFIESRAGFDVGIDQVQSILERLGFNVLVKGGNGGGIILDLTIPSFRNDISIKEDIVEEVMRIYGYDKLPEIKLPNISTNRIINKTQRIYGEVKRVLAASGYDEVVTWSFTDSKYSKLFGELKDELFLQNPISSDLDYMRSSIITNLLKNAKININRGFSDLSIFELGPIFEDHDDIEPKNHVSSIRLGKINPDNIYGVGRNFDIFDVKADLVALCEVVGIDFDKCLIKTDAPSYYHPTRSGSLNLGKNKIAIFGELHPALLKEYDIECSVLSFEFMLNSIPSTKDKYGMRPEFVVSNFPVVSRDFAFVMSDDQPVGEVISAIKSLKNYCPLIKNVSLFDVYSGDNLEKGKKSVAVRVDMQDASKTLVEEEIVKVSKDIVNKVCDKFKASLRG